MKQGKRKTWRKRYFTLTSQKLVCSRTHMVSPLFFPKMAYIHIHKTERGFFYSTQDKEGRGVKQISVGRILDAIECPGPTTSPNPTSSIQGDPTNNEEAIEHCFKIITSDRTYLVNAPTEEDEIRWISALRCLLATYRTNHPPRSFTDILDHPFVT